MKKIIHIALSLSFCLVVLGKNVTLLECVDKATIHFFSSCCKKDIVITKSCCDTAKAPTNSPSIDSVCCNKLPLEISLDFKLEDKRKSTIIVQHPHIEQAHSFYSPLISNNEQRLVKINSPPARNLHHTSLPFVKSLHKNLSVYTC
ncbi:MAG: hypothetical protein HRT88_08435 [Lentisphaeraceae bacterium]|nr:hypothetical protein [Lentisphaeraceae bacterium]